MKFWSVESLGRNWIQRTLLIAICRSIFVIVSMMKSCWDFARGEKKTMGLRRWNQTSTLTVAGIELIGDDAVRPSNLWAASQYSTLKSEVRMKYRRGQRVSTNGHWLPRLRKTHVTLEVLYCKQKGRPQTVDVLRSFSVLLTIFFWFLSRRLLFLGWSGTRKHAWYECMSTCLESWKSNDLQRHARDHDNRQ